MGITNRAKVTSQRLRHILGRPLETSHELLVREGILTVGRHTYGNPEIVTFQAPDGRWMCDRVSIGAFCSFAAEVRIFAGGMHRTDQVTTFPLRSRWDLPDRDADMVGMSHGDVTIGNDVWVATGAWIMSGVTIGDGAVVGARSIVTRDVRPYAVAVGAPAREIRRRFNDQTVGALLSLRWWEWPDDVIKTNVGQLEAHPDLPALERTARSVSRETRE
jgi:acetyltransferase-like isoleucine patch superfamily enzyme